MPSVVVHAVELSRLEVNAPSAQDIDAAFAAVQFGGGNWGAWSGPRPRITRRATIGSGFQTDAVQVYTWPDNAFTQAHNAYQRDQLLAQVRQMLSPLSSDWNVTLENYAPAVNGDLSWWDSGTAAVTQTRDTFPTTTGRVDALENPIGPTTAATHPTTPGQLAGGIGAGLSTILTPVIVLAGVVAVIMLAPRGGIGGGARPAPASRPRAARGALVPAL